MPAEINSLFNSDNEPNAVSSISLPDSFLTPALTHEVRGVRTISAEPLGFKHGVFEVINRLDAPDDIRALLLETHRNLPPDFPEQLWNRMHHTLDKMREFAKGTLNLTTEQVEQLLRGIYFEESNKFAPQYV